MVYFFYASWVRYSKSIPIIKYEELITKPNETICLTLLDIKIKADPILIARAVENANNSNTRLNIGISGLACNAS